MPKKWLKGLYGPHQIFWGATKKKWKEQFNLFFSLRPESGREGSKGIFVGNKAKGQVSKRVFQENKARQIFWKTNISYPLIRTCRWAYQGGKKCSFFGKFGVLCFLETPVLRFALMPYYRRIDLKWFENFEAVDWMCSGL